MNFAIVCMFGKDLSTSRQKTKTRKTALKGQLISKCPFGQKTSSKKPTKYFWISALKFFVPSLWLPGSFWGLPVGFLIYDITYYVPKKPKKLPGSPKEATKNFRTLM